jgi:hypothetical protein
MKPSAELFSVASAFRTFRKGKVRFSYPRHLWDAAMGLTKSHSIEEISKELGIGLSYFRSKLTKASPSPDVPKISFVEASFIHPTKKIEVEVVSTNQRRVFFRVELQSEELLSLIRSLL